MNVAELIRELEAMVAAHGPDCLVVLAIGTHEAESFTVEDGTDGSVVVLEAD